MDPNEVFKRAFNQIQQKLKTRVEAPAVTLENDNPVMMAAAVYLLALQPGGDVRIEDLDRVAGAAREHLARESDRSESNFGLADTKASLLRHARLLLAREERLTGEARQVNLVAKEQNLALYPIASSD